MKLEKRHIAWIDIARTFAILCVLLNHAVDESWAWKLSVINSYKMVSRVFAYSAYTFGRIGVPVFLMISGYLLLDRDWNHETCIKFWKNNWFKLFICTEVWWIIYEVYLNVYYKVPYDIWEIVQHLTFLKMIPLPHVWYMTKILGIYILIPFVGVALKHFDAKIIKFPLLLFGFYVFLCPVISTILTIIGKENIAVQFSEGYCGGEFGMYVIFGYLIKKDLFKDIKTVWLWIVAIISFVVTVFIQMLALEKDIVLNIWYDNGGLLLCSVCLMIIISRTNKIPEQIMLVIKSLSKYSFGIYLTHELILQPMRSVIRTTDFPIVICIIIRYLMTILLTWGVVALICRIKIGKVLFNIR